MDKSTEEKIKEAACQVFTKKGYAATRTRDIAEEAGINLALLNYYFRSKEKLFIIIMHERMQKYFGVIQPTITDETTTLEEKIEKVVELYTDVLMDNPDLAIFILNELRNTKQMLPYFLEHRQSIIESALFKELRERKPEIDPMHFFLNILGMIVFPFISYSMYESHACQKHHDEKEFTELVLERRELIPIWVKAMLA